MPTIHANSIDLFFDEFGDKASPAILLIMGLGTQMIAWPKDFCEMLAGQGFRVIRFDNRDVGLSAKFDHAPKVDILAAFVKALAGQKIDAPYTLDDMALDAIGLLDSLGIANAHIVGASLGGMIAQIIAAKYRERTRSLVSMMSSSGDPRLPPGKPNATATLIAPRPPKNDREASIQFGMGIYRAISSPGYPASDTDMRARVERAFDRSHYPAGIARQMIAILASGSRVDLLKRIRVPTLVLHGADDPLVPVEAGKDTARHIQGSMLKIIPGWGHDIPAQLVPALADAIAAHCKAAESA